MNTYEVTRTISWTFLVEAVDSMDAISHAQDNIDEIEEAKTTFVSEDWEAYKNDQSESVSRELYELPTR